MRREKWCPLYRVFPCAMGFWQNPLRTFPKVRPKLLPYPLGTLHNTLDSILGVYRPVLGHCFSALASTRWADPRTVLCKDLVMGYIGASGSATSSCSHNISQHFLYHVIYGFRHPAAHTQNANTVYIQPDFKYVTGPAHTLCTPKCEPLSDSLEHTAHFKNANKCPVA